jgi:hypothetical protein
VGLLGVARLFLLPISGQDISLLLRLYKGMVVAMVVDCHPTQ